MRSIFEEFCTVSFFFAPLKFNLLTSVIDHARFIAVLAKRLNNNLSEHGNYDVSSLFWTRGSDFLSVQIHLNGGIRRTDLINSVSKPLVLPGLV